MCMMKKLDVYKKDIQVIIVYKLNKQGKHDVLPTFKQNVYQAAENTCEQCVSKVSSIYNFLFHLTGTHRECEHDGFFVYIRKHITIIIHYSLFNHFTTSRVTYCSLDFPIFQRYNGFQIYYGGVQ